MASSTFDEIPVYSENDMWAEHDRPETKGIGGRPRYLLARAFTQNDRLPTIPDSPAGGSSG
jgi:hypothetical protein